MDLRLFWSVIRRHKRLVLTGTLLGLVLAVLAYGHPGLSHGKPTIIPRGAEVWQSESELLITQESFPYGRAEQQYTTGSGKSQPVPIGDIAYMSSLAPIYSALANGNGIQAELKRGAPSRALSRPQRSTTRRPPGRCPSWRSRRRLQRVRMLSFSPNVPQPYFRIGSHGSRRPPA